MNAQNIVFQLPKLKKYCLGVELAPVHQVIKELKMDDLSVGLHAVSCTMLQQLQNVIKKKKNKQKGQASYCNSEHMYSIEK